MMMMNVMKIGSGDPNCRESPWGSVVLPHMRRDSRGVNPSSSEKIIIRICSIIQPLAIVKYSLWWDIGNDNVCGRSSVKVAGTYNTASPEKSKDNRKQ